jgi:hypothetical protein
MSNNEKNETFEILISKRKKMEGLPLPKLKAKLPKGFKPKEKEDAFEVTDDKLNLGDYSWYPVPFEVQPPPIVTSEDVKLIMSCDEIFRGKDGKFVGWPLLKSDDIYAMRIHYFDFKDEDRSSLSSMNPGKLSPKKWAVTNSLKLSLKEVSFPALKLLKQVTISFWLGT